MHNTIHPCFEVEHKLETLCAATQARSVLKINGRTEEPFQEQFGTKIQSQYALVSLNVEEVSGCCYICDKIVRQPKKSFCFRMGDRIGV